MILQNVWQYYEKYEALKKVLLNKVSSFISLNTMKGDARRAGSN